MRTRGCRLERRGEILRFVGHSPVLKFHDADRVRRHAVIAQHEFGDPEIAAADDPPDRKALVVRLNGSALLNVLPAADALARLRIIEHGILAVDFMFGFEIAGVRSFPVALQRRPYGFIIQFRSPNIRRVGKGALAPCPPSADAEWWARERPHARPFALPTLHRFAPNPP